MTVLENSVHIAATPNKVWSVLSSLETLDQYDPGVKKSQIVSQIREGVGVIRRCDLSSGGWFKERVATWTPAESLSFELIECTLPVNRLKHSYTFTPEGTGTLVHQRMEYELKFGLVGTLMDVFMVRKKWNTGIKGFFAGLKAYVEAGAQPTRGNFI